MVEVLIAKKEHIALIAALEKETFANPCSESSLNMFFDTESAFAVICLADGDLVSYCTVVTVLDEAQIINVATDSRYKRKGFAGKVIAKVLSESKKRDITSLSLEVRESNEAAIALYQKLGFSAAGKRKGFYAKPREDALVMTKRLD